MTLCGGRRTGAGSSLLLEERTRASLDGCGWMKSARSFRAIAEILETKAGSSCLGVRYLSLTSGNSM
jgi:hypothetical protein